MHPSRDTHQSSNQLEALWVFYKKATISIMKNSISLIFFLTGLFLISCEDVFEDNKTVDFDSFQMEVPGSWHAFSEVGYDSNVGGITDGKDSLTYEYGWFAYNFSDITTKTHTRIETMIDGHEALVLNPKKKGKDIIGVFIQVDSLFKFNMYGKSKKEAAVLKMFQSIKFE